MPLPHLTINATVIIMITNIVTLNPVSFHNFNLYSLNKEVVKDSYNNNSEK